MDVSKLGFRAEIRVPVDLLQQFEIDPRIVIRHPWVVGIPAPEVLMKPDVLESIKASGYEVMLVPEEMVR